MFNFGSDFQLNKKVSWKKLLVNQPIKSDPAARLSLNLLYAWYGLSLQIFLNCQLILLGAGDDWRLALKGQVFYKKYGQKYQDMCDIMDDQLAYVSI